MSRLVRVARKNQLTIFIRRCFRKRNCRSLCDWRCSSSLIKLNSTSGRWTYNLGTEVFIRCDFYLKRNKWRISSQ